jgi:hypothetical protein
MRIRRIARSAAFIAGLAALPLAPAKAQYYYGPPYYPPPAYGNPCWFPLFWPVCLAGAIVGTAGVIVTAPFRPVAPPPPYYGPPYYPPPAYAPGYYPPQYNYGYYGPR